MRFFILRAIVLILCFSVQAQTIRLELQLSSNNVSDITEQSNGLLWAATDEGLNVFYDNEKHVFYSDIQDSLSLLNSKVDNLIVTYNDNLIALSQDGLSVFNSDKFNFIQIKLASKPVSVVEELDSGDLWVATESSGYYLINSDFKIKGHYTFDPLNPLSISTSKLSKNNENSIIFSDSKAFISSNNGFNIFNKKLKTFKRYFKGKKSKLSSNNIVGIEGFNKKILIASENELVVFDIESSKFEGKVSTSSSINSLSSIPEGPVFLRTVDADYVVSLNSNDLKINALKTNSIPTNNNMTRSNSHLLFWDKNSSSITQTDYNFTNKTNYSTGGALSSVKVHANKVYFGTNNGVKKLEKQNVSVNKLDAFIKSDFFYVFKNQQVNISDNTIEVKDLNNNSVYKKDFSVNFSKMSFETNGNLIFIGKKNLHVFDLIKKNFHESVLTEDSFKGYTIDNMKSIDDTLYVSHDNGLFEIPINILFEKNTGSQLTFYDYNELLNSKVPRGFVDIEKIGSLYYVTNQQSGLSVYKNDFNSFIKNFKFNGDSKNSLATSTPTKLMYILGERVLYVGSIGSGLFKYHLDDSTFSNLNIEDGMLSNNVYDFLQSSERLFFQSGTGINFIENGLIKNITIEDGLSPVTFHKESLHKINNEIIVSGEESLQSFSLESIKPSNDNFKINSFNIVGIDELNDRKVLPINNGVINVDYKIKTILFDLFSDTSYKSNQVKYFVEKENGKELVKNGYNNQIQLSGLPYYTSNLNFYGINGNGEKSSNSLSISVYNAPPWWLRVESVFGYIILLIVLVAFFVKYREKKAKELMEGERKSKELEEAKELQSSLLPKVLPVVEGFEISTYLKPATEIGGDYYDFFYKKGKYFYAICGDATGHGVTSGIMVSVTKAGLNGVPMGTPSIILEQLNRIVKRVNFGRLRMSLSVAKFNKNAVEISSAAMPPTYFFSSKSKEVEEVLVPNLPLGGLEGEKFDGVKKDFKAGDVMVMISDGLPELPNPTNDLLDYEKVENCIKENAECSAEEIKNALVYLSDDWAKGVMNPDDITIVVIKKAA